MIFPILLAGLVKFVRTGSEFEANAQSLSPTPTPTIPVAGNILEQMNVAITHNFGEKDILPGDIVSISSDSTLSGVLVRSKIPYDDKMFGLVVQSSAIVLRTNSNFPIARSGKAAVNVTTLGGPIAAGDYITSSAIAGKGQKASDMSGFVLGVALGSFTDKDGTEMEFEKKKIRIGQIRVEVGIGPASPVSVKAAGGLFGTLRQLMSALIYNIQTSKQLDKIIRYIIAALVAGITIFLNFRTFGKNITKGIEAIGRNPLAKISIQSMIIVNVILIAIISIGGIILSLAILSL